MCGNNVNKAKHNFPRKLDSMRYRFNFQRNFDDCDKLLNIAKPIDCFFYCINFLFLVGFNMVAKDELLYFNIYGRAEPIRMLYAVAGVDFDDKRIETSDWPALKPGV